MAKGSTLKNALIAFAITTLAMLSLSGPAMAQDELFEDRIERLEERIDDINDKISDLRSDIRNTDNQNVKDRKLAKIVLLKAKRVDVRARLREVKRQSNHHARLIRKGWRTVFRDEFNGSELKSDNWSHEVNCSGGGNNEKQCYTARDENSYVADGLLHIVAKEESYSGPALVDDDPNYDPNDTSITQPYTSARIRSKDKVDFTYGRIETRAKLTAGQGMWPAIWMLPTDYVYGGWPSSGEIDILEAVNLGVWPNEVHGTLHYGLKWPQWENHGQTLATEFNPADDFHVYAVEWEADEIRWYIDGKHYQTQRSEGWYNYIWQGQEQGFGVANPRAPFDQNFHIIMNLAAGGDWPGNPDTGWTEDRELQVDYVRVYQCRQPRRNGNSEEGTGCASVDENVVVNEDAGAPGVNDYLVYSDGVQTLELEGRSNTPSLGFWELDEGSLIQSEIDLGAEQGLVWDVEFNGLSNVFLTAEDMSEVEGFDTGVALSGGAGWSNNGEIEFDMLVVDASVDSQFTVKLDSGYPNTGAVTIDTPEIGVWQKVSVQVSELMANPIPEGGGVNLANVLNMFVLEYAGSSAHVQIDNIRLQCAVNTEPEVWQLDQVCSIEPIVSTVAPSGDEVEVYIDSVTEWDLGVCCGGGAAIEQVDNGGGDMALQFNYDGDPGTNTVTFFQPPAPVDLSQFAGGTVEFDMFVITQPTNPAPNPWLIKVDCDTGCSSGDTPITASLEGVQPPTGSWQHYTFDLDTLVGQGLDLSKVSALVIFPAWGNQDNASYQLDNVKFVKGSTSSEPTTAAPTPTVPAGNVISVFSDAYTNIGGINYNPNWGQATVVTEESIAGNNTLKYAGLNYQGTDFAGNPQDVSAMDSFHLDFWTADSTELNVYLISPGPAETAYSLPVTPGTWVSVDIPLSEFSGVDLSNVIQLKFDGNGTVFLDNMYFSSAAPATEPTVAAPTPTVPAANVVSLFSDAYTNIGGIDYNPNWGQATVVTQELIAGNNTLKYAGLNYQGTDFAGNPQDVSGLDVFHVDLWTADSTALNIYLISPGPAETAYSLPVTPGTWVSVDIPLSEFSGVDLSNVIQVKVDGNGTVFFDNLYFASSAPATEPAVPAPVPMVSSSNVISLFSDSYTNIGGIDYNPNWGQGTVVTQETIGGDAVLKYAGLNYQGTDFAGNPQDVSGMDSFHVDFWTADSSNLNIYLISPGPVEVAYSLPVTPGTWVSVDIPLSAFAGVDLTNVFQLKVDGNGTVFFDNLYFSSSNGGGGGGGSNGELTTNGNFETGDKSGWTEFTSGFGGGSFTVETAFDGFAGKLAAGRNESPVIKQANIGGSAVSPNMPVTISFDLSGDLQGAGGVVFAEFFSELSGEGVSKAEILGGSPLFPASSEASYCFETTTGADVSGGITLQLKAACGDVEGCSVDAFFDNASVKLGNSCGL